MAAERIRMLIVDDYDIVREGIASILRAEPDFEVVGEATSGEEALRLCRVLRPAVVLLDLKMHGMDGIETCRRLGETCPDAAVIILTAYLDSDTIYRCIEAGAKGYVIKDVERLDLKRKIRAVARGEAVLDDKAAGPVMERLKKATLAGRPQLTERELAILKAIAEGLTNKEIGQRLYLSEATIKDQVKKICDKLEVEHRISAVLAAAKEGLI
jgi:two-component system NarL family response regulator